MNSLPLFIYTAYTTARAAAIARAFGAASVLLAMVLALFVVIRLLVARQGGVAMRVSSRTGSSERRRSPRYRARALLLGGRFAGRRRRAVTALIEGSGSSWAANAVNQWVADVASEGIQVVYTPDGDAQGRQDFANAYVRLLR